MLATAYLKYTHKSGPALTDGADVHDGTTVFADGQRGTEGKRPNSPTATQGTVVHCC
ncbi:hypothetical protein [Streptomyces violaceus]|uniref:Uncharacterized protein n=1 Tax=Streptomyces violaceus TaxID=1936 RepID=A0ABY9U081_STRVL|nr:hypothetical protein [Streptomyces janthinus]WND16003.1 hypothetical protein RI060_00925 [Streptomyces janthinus]GGS95154.1 hypothetical protein GCM10010270_78990 [Streptomyces janthinus]